MLIPVRAALKSGSPSRRDSIPWIVMIVPSIGPSIQSCIGATIGLAEAGRKVL
jgi:hypothetical protein